MLVSSLRVRLDTTARTSPAATCAPGFTSISVTTPACGALTVCCIFIASSTSTGWPAATSAPTSTATLTTVPGIGASSEPLATASAGSVKRGTRVSRDVAAAASPRRRRRRSTATCVRRRATPSASRVTEVRTRRDHGDAVDGVAVPAAEPGHLDLVVAGRAGRTPVDAAAGRRRCARRPGCRAGRCAPRAAALGQRDARRPWPRPHVRRRGAPRVGRRRRGSAVLTSPARNASSRRTATSRSRLVTTPWIRARRSAPASRRAACSRVGAQRDHLGEHRVVVRRDLAAGLEAGVEPDAGAVRAGRTRRRPRDLERRQRAALRLPVGGRVLGVQPHLDRVAVRSAPIAARVERSRPSATASCSSTRSTPCTSSVTGCSTWRRVFISRNQKRSVAGVEEELDGAGAAVVDRRGGRCGPPSCSARRVSSARPGAGASSTTFWCRRWIEQSRSPSTRTPPAWPTTCTSTWRPCSTYGSTKTVPSPNADAASAARLLDLARQVGQARTIAHAAAAAARGRLHQQRQVGLGGGLDGVRLPSTGTPAASISFLALDLGAHLLDRLRRRADPGQPGVDDGAGEVGVLGQEAVAGVDGVGAGPAGRLEDQVDAQVGLRGRVPGQPHGGVGLARRTAARRRRRSGRPRSRCRAGGRSRRPGGRSRPGWRPGVESDPRGRCVVGGPASLTS